MAAHRSVCARATGSQSYRKPERIKKLRGYREVFKPSKEAPDPGRIFYTITEEDVGRRIIRTTDAVIHVGDILGAVQLFDVGRRVYRIPAQHGQWIWQAENASQMHARLAKEKHDATA